MITIDIHFALFMVTLCVLAVLGGFVYDEESEQRRENSKLLREINNKLDIIIHD